MEASKLKTRDAGKVGEMIAMTEFVKLGYDILLPTSDHLPFDFAVHLNGLLKRVQVKGRTPTNGKLEFTSNRSPFYNSKGLNSQRYTEEDFDLMVVVDLVSEECYCLLAEQFFEKKVWTLRVSPPKNKQVKSITLADEYKFLSVVKGISQ